MKLVAFLAARDPARAKAFYGDTLGFRLISEDAFALVFDVQGTILRIATVPQMTPAEYTVLGWEVDDIRQTVAAFAERGMRFQRYEGMQQDELGIWTAPSGARVAWFRDPDGNLLSFSEPPGRRVK